MNPFTFFNRFRNKVEKEVVLNVPVARPKMQEKDVPQKPTKVYVKQDQSGSTSGRGFWFNLFDQNGKRIGCVIGEDCGVTDLSFNHDIEYAKNTKFMNREFAAKYLSEVFDGAILGWDLKTITAAKARK